MNKLTNKRTFAVLVLALVFVLASCSMCFATSGSVTIENAVSPVVTLINSLLKPLMAIVGAVGVLYCVVLGVKYARAEEPQDREKAKAHLKNAIIGFVLIFVLIVLLNQFIGPLMNWATGYKSTL